MNEQMWGLTYMSPSPGDIGSFLGNQAFAGGEPNLYEPILDSHGALRSQTPLAKLSEGLAQR